jgi:hypothetical protein
MTQARDIASDLDPLDPLVKPLVSLRWTSYGREIGAGCWRTPR